MLRRLFFSGLLLLVQNINLYSNMEMAIMMGAQLGASIADTTVSNMYKQVAKGIENDQTNMTIASKTFLQSVQLAQQEQLKKMAYLFSSAQEQVNTMMTQQTNIMQQMQSYIEGIVSLQTPTPEYLKYPIDWDQIFANSTMYTPQGRSWKNIFQLGNWQYDETTNSFWQMQQEPFLTPGTPSSIAPINNAYQNSIFTEWQTRQPYIITCDVTLYQVTYPFYAGIIFNKTRWISGDTYGLQKYRTIGLYGNEKKQISLCYAEQTIPSTTSTIMTPQYPLTQIYAGLGTQKIIINQSLFQNLQEQPLTMHLKIKPGINSVEYKIWPNDGTQEPQSYILIKTATTTAKTSKKSTANSVTITATSGANYTYQMANDSDMYLYHGIGFLSPGAIAQFNLKDPKKLMFTPESIQTFTQDFTAYIKELQAKTTTQQINAAKLNEG